MNDTEWMEEIIKYQSQLRIIDEEMQLLNRMLEPAEGSLQEAWKGSNADLALDKLLQIKSRMKKTASAIEQVDGQLKGILQEQTTE